MRNKLLSLGLIGFLIFLLISPVFGWHIHHACMEGSHGFEVHSHEVCRDNSHGTECQSESVFQHTFEQGSVTSTVDVNGLPFWNQVFIASSILPVQVLFPRIATVVTYCELDDDVGSQQRPASSIQLRAPPAS